MKHPRTTYTLIGLFFAGLVTLWWLERAGVLTQEQRRERQSSVLPELLETPESEIARLEIARGGERLAFERRGPDRWQMVEPIDVAADPTILESLVRNLKGLRKSPDAGTIVAAGDEYGLVPPEASVRLFGRSSAGERSPSAPLAALEIGKATGPTRFVRPSGTRAIEVVDRSPLAVLDRPLPEWRQTLLVPIPSFQVSRVVVRGSGLGLEAERVAGGRWKLTTPVAVPANGAKIESLLAAVSGVRIVDGSKGYVEDNAKDLAPYGLDHPSASIEISRPNQPGKPLTLLVGRESPREKDRVYVRLGDQDDVVLVHSRFLSEIPRDRAAWRGQNVTDINPAAVSAVRVEALDAAFQLRKQAKGWVLTSPTSEPADAALVQSFIEQVDQLQASEFLEPGRVRSPELDPPVMWLKLWQSDPNASSSGAPDGRPPVASIKIGRHDVLRKTVYGQIEGDDMILALPDRFLSVLPTSHYAYRDRGLLSLSPSAVSRLTIVREGATFVLEPGGSGSTPNQWKLVRPVEAPADMRVVTQVLAMLANLRAEEFVADLKADEGLYGLAEPAITVSWEDRSERGGSGSHGSRWLKIGKPVPDRPGQVYALLEGKPIVFTLSMKQAVVLLAEFHESRVFSVAPESVQRLVFRLPDRALGFRRRPVPTGKPNDWSAEPGTDMSGIDLSRFNGLVQQLGELQTPRFYQYKGPIPEETGLSQPRLVLEVYRSDGKPPSTLRIGNTNPQGLVYSATGTNDEGPVFFLPAAAWDALIQSLDVWGEIPRDPFAP
jgi:hypothetical protein